LFILLATFLAAHTINAYVAYSLNQPIAFSATPPQSHEEIIDKQNPQSVAQEILAGHLFLLPPNASAIGSAAQAAPPPPPMDVAKKMSLLGTVFERDAGVMAVLEEISTKTQILYRLGAQVPNAGTLASIEKNRVLFRQGTTEEWLPLALAQAVRLVEPNSTPPTSIPRPAGSQRTILDRKETNDALADTTRLLTEAQADPYLNEGKLEGLRFTYVMTHGFFQKIGLQPFDILQRINGVEVRDSGTMLSLLQQLRNEQNVRLDLIRNNQRRTLTFEIR